MINNQHNNENGSHHTGVGTGCQPPKITKEHYEYLTDKRKLEPLWVIANCRSVAPGEWVPELGYSVGEGYDEHENEFRTWGILFKGANGEVQYRPDTPYRSKKDLTQDNKKAPKYRGKAKSKGDCDLILPNDPTNPERWDDLEAIRKDCHHMDDIDWIVLTEGIIKAITGMVHGILTVAALGVWMALIAGSKPSKATAEQSGQQESLKIPFFPQADIEGGKRGEASTRKPVASLSRLISQRIGFIIAFDADCANNKNVRDAQRELVNVLTQLNVPVRIVTGLWSTEQGKGMDDFINKNGADAFKRLLAQAMTPEAWEKQFSVADQVEVANGKTKGIPSPKNLGLEIAEKYKEVWAFQNEQKQWRIYTDKAWDAIDNDVIQQIVKAEIESRNINYPNHRYVEDVIKTIKYTLLIRKWQVFPRHQWVAFDNCVVNIETGEQHEHSPGFRFTSYLPREYSPIINDENLNTATLLNKHCPHFYQWAMNAMQGDVKKVFRLLSIINGLIRFKFHDWHTFVHLVGEPRSGKGTFTRILEKIVGEENTKSSTLAKLDVDTEIARVINAQLVICPDEDKKVGNHGNFKAMTGGDTISYREIYKQGAESKFFGLIVVVSNYPVFAGDTTGISDRLCLVHFNNPVAKDIRDSRIESKIETELTALTSIALGLNDDNVKASVKGLGEADIPEFRWQEWHMRTQTDTLAAFIEDCVVYEKDVHSSVSDFFKAYQQHAEESGAQGGYKIQTFSEHFVRITKWLGWDCIKKKFAACYKFTNVRLRFKGEDDLPSPGDCIGDSPMQTPCRPDADPAAYLQPAPTKDSADHADLNSNNLQTSIYDFLPPANYQVISEPEAVAPVQEDWLAESAQSAQVPSGTGFGSASEAAQGLQETESGLHQESEPLKVGDIVSGADPYTEIYIWKGRIDSIANGEAKVSWIIGRNMSGRYELSQLCRVAGGSVNNSVKIE